MNTEILQQINRGVSNLDLSISTLFTYLSHIGKAITTTYSYVSALPDYIQNTCMLIIGIAIIYLVAGR